MEQGDIDVKAGNEKQEKEKVAEMLPQDEQGKYNFDSVGQI